MTVKGRPVSAEEEALRKLREDVKRWQEITKNALDSLNLIDQKHNALRAEFDEFKKRVTDFQVSVPIKPKSARAMTVEDARKIVLGDWATKTPKEVAILSGLSYGQVYSARNGYTFKEVYEEKLKRDRKEADQAALKRIEEEKKKAGR